jgi:hypothetical protein
MKKLLAIAAVLALTCVSFGQSHTIPTTDRSNTWSGTNDFTGTFKLNGNTLPACS